MAGESSRKALPDYTVSLVHKCLCFLFLVQRLNSIFYIFISWILTLLENEEKKDNDAEMADTNFIEGKI